MIESIEFKNFKALRDTTLPLGRFTLIVGPNGSGKSTAMQALEIAGGGRIFEPHRYITVDRLSIRERDIELSFLINVS
ncbi:MAG: AAA family ATPase, partial [Blastocatellia bacterium]|nr:AAA family ATPase [Blastocatellia bacterium]